MIPQFVIKCTFYSLLQRLCTRRGKYQLNSFVMIVQLPELLVLLVFIVFGYKQFSFYQVYILAPNFVFSVWIWFDLTIKTLTHVYFRTAWLTKHLKVTFKTSLQKPWKPFYESGNNFNTDRVGGTAVLAWKLGRSHLI